MSHYNFKSLPIVPNSKDFIDIVLSKTQRKTPTVIHRHFKISRIRDFYIKKVKFTQQNFHDKLSQIVTDFPKLDSIHPFYSDLMNTLYDRDHYKIALGHLSFSQNLINNIARDYTRQLKYGDSLYRCKQLKIAAMGRMCTIMKRQNKSLEYLEQVRQHLSRLPSIDPNSRSIIVCGFPNVGKSSFVNKISRADVEVQPYAFTTKSLFIGHTDYEYLRWQIIDTPGLLDQPLQERSTIEMQAITALAHLRAAVLYLIDISEQCGQSIEQQIDLFRNIMPIFKDKPLCIALNKIDIINPEELNLHDKSILESIRQEGVPLVPMSTVTGQGVIEAKINICDLLLAQRVDNKLQGKKSDQLINRLYVSLPKPRDNKLRPPCIPNSIIEKRKALQTDTLEDSHLQINSKPLLKHIAKKLQEEYTPDYRIHWLLDNEEERYDAIPEILNGHNVSDFIDPDILLKVKALEREEGLREQSGFYEFDSDMESDEMKNMHTMAEQIRSKRKIIIEERRVKRSKSNAQMPKTKLLRARSLSAKRNSATLSYKLSNNMEIDSVGKQNIQNSEEKLADHSKLRERSVSLPRDMLGVLNPITAKRASKLKKYSLKRMNKKLNRAGEADRRINTKRPKHLFAGKRKLGKTSRR